MRPSSRTSPSSRRKIRYGNRSDTTVIVPERRSAPLTAGQRTCATFWNPTRWLLDVVLASSIGSGTREGWDVTALHRTLIQTGEDPGDAPAALARLLSQLDLMSAA